MVLITHKVTDNQFFFVNLGEVNMTKKINLDTTIAVVGLGYVGLPLALEFGKFYKTVAYDISDIKISSYLCGVDPTGQIEKAAFEESRYFKPTTEINLIKEADFVIVAVPTPVDSKNRPDFSALEAASISVGKNLKYGAIVVYESTVYPGATEELCMPILEKESGYLWKDGFFLGYSPERINPGDPKHTLTNITKVVSGDSKTTLDLVSELYKSIISAGIFSASSIKVAEAAKVIENTQRDLNIALINELSLIFHRLEIDTAEVLEAAGTKWNFLPFKPGLVGGHCIGVDPYYLTHKAEEAGYHPKIILSGRHINDGMAQFIANETVKELINLNIPIKGTKIIIMGLTFKENCSDLRNSKVVDLVNSLSKHGLELFIYDPVASATDAEDTYDIKLTEWDNLPASSAIIEAVSHDEITNLTIESIKDKLLEGGLYVDIKSRADKLELISHGYNVWRL